MKMSQKCYWTKTEFLEQCAILLWKSKVKIIPFVSLTQTRPRGVFYKDFQGCFGIKENG